MLFCITHGREHYPGETEDVALLGDDLTCHEVEWTVVTGSVLDCSPEGTETDTFHHTLGSGELAYLDTRPGGDRAGSGLVPVKILSIEPLEGDDEDAHTLWHQADLRVTASRPGFTRGQRLEVSVPNPMLLSRACVYTERGQVKVMGPTRFITEEGELL